jgi:hypothetical protein
LKADEGVFRMETVRGGDVDGVDSRVSSQLFVTVVDLSGAVRGSEAAGAGGVSGCDGVKAGVACQREGSGKFVSDLSGANDPPAILLHAAK